MFARGILPLKYGEIPPEHTPSDHLNIEYDYFNGDFDDLSSGIYYGDASGGENTAFSSLRRVGCSFVYTINSIHQATVSFNLPGVIQTVFRGELFAISVLMRLCVKASNIVFITDNLLNYELFHDRDRALQSLNHDLFSEIFYHISNKEKNAP